MSFGFGFGLPRAPLRGRPLVATIRSLFAANEPGVWYDPSDLSTLYQDSAGTTPVTAVEQPVGLMLDKSKGLVLGPELVTNGTFDTDTAWTKVRGAVISEGAANIPATGYIFQVKNLQQGKFYLVTATISNYVVGSGQHVQYRYDYGGGTTRTIFSIGRNGSFSGVLNIDYAPSGQGVFVESQSGSFTIDNISVREIPGNHAYQTTATSRPVLSARVNLLTKTEQFDDAVWGKTGVTVTPNTATAPDGTVTADLVIPDTTTTVNHYPNQILSLTPATYTYSVYARAANYNSLILRSDLSGYVEFNLSAGVVSATAGSNYTGSITNVGNGWYRCAITFTVVTGGIYSLYNYILSVTGGAAYAGDGTSGIYIWGADLRVANDGANLPPYQRVNTATDYDTVGFPHYLRFDGVDDWLVTNTITPGTDKAQVFAGVRKLSDAAAGMLLELGAGAVSGSFQMVTSGLAGDASRRTWVIGHEAGGAELQGGAATFPAPDTRVLTGSYDRAGTVTATRLQLRLNTAPKSLVYTAFNPTTGNYLAYPLYIGRRGGTSLPFNGHLYSLIVRFGSNLPIATIEKTEKYINTKTRAY